MIDFDGRAADVRGNPNTRLVRNISLPVDDGRSHAITLFCSQYGTDCIQIDGDVGSQIGSILPRSSPVTFYTQPGEVVDAVYAVKRELRAIENFACFHTPAPLVLVRHHDSDRGTVFIPFHGPY